jgi:hypothetical protein
MADNIARQSLRFGSVTSLKRSRYFCDASCGEWMAHRFGAAQERVLSLADLVVRVGPGEEAEVFVETAPGWVHLGSEAQVPLADHGGDVAGGLQRLRQRDLVGRQAEVLGLVGAGVELVPEALLVAPGQHSRARRAAHGAGDVSVGEADALLGNRVDVGGFDVIAELLSADVGVAEVVGDDEDDVGFRRRLDGPRDRSAPPRQRRRQ